MTKRNISLSIMLLVAMLYSSWLVLQTKQQTLPAQTNMQRPDSFAEDIIAIDIDKMGKLHSKLISPRITHYASNNTSLFTDPHFILYSENENPWHTTSRFAKAINGTEQLYLWNQVKIQQEAGRNNRSSTMTTDELTFFVNRHYAQTDKFVQFDSPDTRVTGVGMHAFLKEKRILLLSKTRGIHENKSP